MLRLALFVALLGVPAGAAAGTQTVSVPLRGRTIALTVYQPSGVPKGTIVMGSGDVGWVGLAVSMAQDLSARGFVVAGVNVRQYLAAFTSGKAHLTTTDVPGDYRAMADALRQQHLLPSPVILSGVSEGAALAALAASDARNHDWVDGVNTMGLPEVAELAWRWSDVAAWITKRDANEPSFETHAIVGAVSPVPLAMIQSTKDEYVSVEDYRRLLQSAREPKEQVLIDAGNHRFTDRQPQLRAAYEAALGWVLAARAAERAAR